MGILFLYGNEPYCIDSRKKKALKGVSGDPMNYVTLKGSFDAEVLNTCNTFPFLAERKGVVLDVDTLDDLDTEAFHVYLASPADFTELVIVCRKADARKKLFKKLKEAKIAVECNKVEDQDTFDKVILYELKQAGAQIKPDALLEFGRRINYFGKADQTLMAAVGYILNVTAVTKEIEKEHIETFVPIFAEPDVFSLAKLMASHNLSELYKQVDMIPDSDAIKVMSLLLRNFRVSLKLRMFRKNEVLQQKYSDPFENLSEEKLLQGLGVLTDGISKIKTGDIPDSLSLRLSCAKCAALL